jgi:hypothetical protein
MAFQTHTIARYNYSFDARLGGPGLLQLWGADGSKLADISFVDDSAALPPPQLWPNLSGAKAAFRRSSFPLLVDMLRNEAPVWLVVNDQPPGFVFVQTDQEPTGEGES